MISSSSDKRIDFRIPVDFLLNKYIKGRPYVSRASNMSRCGVLLHKVFEPIHADTQIGLQFQLPGTDRVITCAGRVLYDHTHMEANGVVFTNVAPEHQAIIDEFILKHLDWASLL
jgi:hypothetical protein